MKKLADEVRGILRQSGPSPPASGTITEFNAPGAGTGQDQGTLAYGINTSGVIAGEYLASDNVAHAFRRAASGTITGFEVPGARGSSGQGTTALGINDADDIVGSYVDSSALVHGFPQTP